MISPELWRRRDQKGSTKYIGTAYHSVGTNPPKNTVILYCYTVQYSITVLLYTVVQCGTVFQCGNICSKVLFLWGADQTISVVAKQLL